MNRAAVVATEWPRRLRIGGAILGALVGVVVLGVPFALGVIAWPLLISASILGLATVVGLGLLMAGIEPSKAAKAAKKSRKEKTTEAERVF